MTSLIQALSCHLDHGEEVEGGLGKLEAASGAVGGAGADVGRRVGKGYAGGEPRGETETGLQGGVQI